jgi:hypothetical protein
VLIVQVGLSIGQYREVLPFRGDKFEKRAAFREHLCVEIRTTSTGHDGQDEGHAS